MITIDIRWRLVVVWIMLASLVDSDESQSTLPPRPKKPHIILMLADDLGWNDVSWNNPKVVTPHLGKLASEGVILNHSYVLPTCSPTRAALLTGRYPFTYGMEAGPIDAFEPRGVPLKYKMLPKSLRKLGYSTHAIGKWHLGFCSWRYVPTRRGFDTFYGFYGGAEDYYSHKRDAKNTVAKQLRRVTRNDRRKFYLDLRNNTKPDPTKKGIYSTYMFASAAEELLRSRDPKKPMFLYLPFQSVHGPLQVPKNYSRVMKHVKNYIRRNFLGMVMAMDDYVGRVVAALKDTGHYDNSVIIFSSDNGGSIRIGASNYPLRGGKTNVLEGGTRSPTIIHSPFLPNSGTVSDQLFHVTDWYNTIIGLAGGKPRRYLDSIDQWHAITGASWPPRQRLVYNIDNNDGYFRAAIRFNEMKLAVGHIGSKTWAPFYPVYKARHINSNNASMNNLQSNYLESLHLISSNSHKVKDSFELPIEKNGFSTRNIRSATNHGKIKIKFPNNVYNDNKKPIKNCNKRPTRRRLKDCESKIVKKNKKNQDMKNQHKNNNKPHNPNWNKKSPFTRWWRLKYNTDIQWNKYIMKKLDKFIPDNMKIRLYNITADPGESVDLSRNELETIKEMMTYLAVQLYNFVPQKPKRRKPRAHPKYWGNVWSPGWCKAV